VFIGKRWRTTGSCHAYRYIENIFFCNISISCKECVNGELKVSGDDSAFLFEKNLPEKDARFIAGLFNKLMLLPLYSNIRSRQYSAIGELQKSASFVADYTPFLNCWMCPDYLPRQRLRPTIRST
jgi:hypothetical protein